TGDESVDIAHRQVDDRHAEVVHARHEVDGQPGGVGEKGHPNQVDQGGHGTAHTGGQVAIQELHMNVCVLAHAHRAADEGDDDQQIAGDLLGPGGRVFEHVAREELI